ncbi:hypothetical protein [Dolichospermum sp. UHCC 0259]|uniref:hypothetical protein n=1 Tax=Dolichospermum sp. UHCC 0259 TaxID=2590010 RepID=UPI001445A73C|nr:hypothetical protein [Dolichospermum sp. UHCC 0259]MTJ50765.1 hypothetical protein [Dolichospermum sp. UHCC 0259]
MKATLSATGSRYYTNKVHFRGLIKNQGFARVAATYSRPEMYEFRLFKQPLRFVTIEVGGKDSVSSTLGQDAT